MEESVTIVEMDSFTKERPRTNFYTRAIYTPQNTLKRERYIAFEFKRQNKNWEVTDKPLEVEIEAEINIPSGAKKKDKEQMLKGEILPTKKPDVDNVAKLVLDALNGVAFYDDKQIVSLKINKKYGVKKILKINLRKI